MKKFDVGKHRIIIKKVHKSGYMSSGGRPKAKFNVDGKSVMDGKSREIGTWKASQCSILIIQARDNKDSGFSINYTFYFM